MGTEQTGGDAMEQARRAFDAGADGSSQTAANVAALQQQVADLMAERDAAIARAEKAEAGGKKAKAKVAELPAEKKPRTLKAIDDDKALDRDALKAAIAGAETVEIAFVGKGDREVAGSQPQAIEGEVWKDHPRGLMLDQPVTLHGPAQGGAAYQVAGYALIVDGKPVARTMRSEPLMIAPGQTVKLENDIHF
ncbi:hypothetical protein SAMN05192580_1358 [Sphingomonas jatrophae]|uniref:Uncharacterized protein n=2 Tax=Sphingomonas jatrophae TaxID=1166337 RepID=A0A1I6K5R0_9SPHN|nr:hypothetical protein SAMN05192580_1358 [Sphingomonas jatrophae]